VSVLTGNHDINRFGRERQTAIQRSGRDVVVGEGAWLASHVLVLGPCRIGEHAVVAAGRWSTATWLPTPWLPAARRRWSAGLSKGKQAGEARDRRR
jgi:hypothetical protein